MIHRVPVAARVGLAAMVVFNLAPFYWVVTSSLKSATEVVSFPATLFPHTVTLDAYREIWISAGFFGYFVNSMLVAGGTALLSGTLALSAAYGLSRFRFPGHGAVMVILLSSQMIPGVLLVVPYFKLMTVVGLFDTRIGLILALTTITLPFSVWMLKGYMDTIPQELDQAAMLDGASRMQILTRVIFPIVLPGLIATATFAFLLAWGDLLWALCLISDEARITMSLGLTRLMGQFKVLWSQTMAAVVIASVIPAVLYTCFQRYLVRGYAGASVKE